MSDDEEIANVRRQLASTVAELASQAVEIAAKHRVALDFSEASIAALNRYLADLAGWSLTETQKDNAADLFAAYLLEVGMRAHGGFFQWWEEREAPVLVVGSPDCHIGMLARDKVRGRIGGDASDDIAFFYSGFAERARRRQPGDSATYV
jgi:hypothetical protein